MSNDKTFLYDPSTGSLKSFETSPPSLMLMSMHLRDDAGNLSGSVSFEQDLSPQNRHTISEWVTQMKRAHSPSLTGNLTIQFAVLNTDIMMEAKVQSVEARDGSSDYPIVKEGVRS